MEIRFKVDIKTAKRALALINADIPSDEKIKQKLSNVIVDLSNSEDEDIQQAALGLTLMAIGTAFENESKK